MLKQSRDLPWTIVRPSHTVRTIVPTMLNERDSLASRLLAGRPVLVAGDGATPWTMTRCVDFARPFVKLFGRKETLGEDFHITSDNAYTWDSIYKTLGAGLGVKADIVHVPTDTLVRYCPDWQGPLTGDKCWAAVFDNSKVKSVVGDFACEKNLAEVLKDSVAHVKARLEKNGPQSGEHDALMDRIAKEQRALGT
jgi:nucleoside-diphosphate-sugar epimerase